MEITINLGVKVKSNTNEEYARLDRKIPIKKILKSRDLDFIYQLSQTKIAD